MRRMIAVLLALTILLPFGISAAGTQKAYAATSNAPKIMEALGIMTTDKGDISETTEKITRSQYAQLLVNMSSLKDITAISSNVSLFSDVSKKYWAAGYIKTAISNGWMYGYLNGSFKPNQGVTLLEAVNGVLKLLGYTDSDFTGNTAANKMALYISKGLNTNITVSKKTAVLDYDNCVNLFYNTLKATTKDSKIYAETLGYTLDSNGEIDYLSLMNSDIEGPVIVDGNWKQEISFNTVNATYYKNGIKCTYTDIEDYDVLYYSETF
ncbi:MAG: S-layer homology domain-containing protein, partial [Mobilitalea sp.]